MWARGVERRREEIGAEVSRGVRKLAAEDARARGGEGLLPRVVAHSRRVPTWQRRLPEMSCNVSGYPLLITTN